MKVMKIFKILILCFMCKEQHENAKNQETLPLKFCICVPSLRYKYLINTIIFRKINK